MALQVEEIARLVGERKSVILDIGANNGSSGAAIGRALPNATIYAFECDPRAIKKFRAEPANANISLEEKAIGQGPSRRVRFYQSGNTDVESIVRDFPEGWDYSGSIHRPTGHLEEFSWVTFEKEIEVDLISLDEWAEAKGIADVDFIWADVQGAEADLIQGGVKLLSRTRYFYTECYEKELYEGAPSLKALVNMLPGFEVVTRYPEDVLFRNLALT